ncbi:MAG: hypothetical protein RR359_04395 [Bacilli bacterium]
MKQNILKETKDGVVKFQFEKCLDCKYHDDCYKDCKGNYHKGTPIGLSEECLEDKR